MWISIAIIVALVLVFGVFIYFGRRGDSGISGPDDKRHQIPPSRHGGFGPLV